MKKLIKIAFLALALIAINTTARAQKYGHLNSGNLISNLAETKSADSQLRTYQEQLIKKGQTMAENFEKEYVNFMERYQKGEVTPAVAQAKEEEFRKKQEDIQRYEQKVMNDVTQKREELFAPILKKVQDAIDAVGKEGGYAMIFDTSILANNPIVFANPSDDLMAKVKAKLGL